MFCANLYKKLSSRRNDGSKYEKNQFQFYPQENGIKYFHVFISVSSALEDGKADSESTSINFSK